MLWGDIIPPLAPPRISEAHRQVRVYSLTQNLVRSPELFRFTFDDSGDFRLAQVHVSFRVTVFEGAKTTPNMALRMMFPSAAGPMTEGDVPLEAWTGPGDLVQMVGGGLAMREIPSRGFLECYLSGEDGVLPPDATIMVIGTQGREVDGYDI